MDLLAGLGALVWAELLVAPSAGLAALASGEALIAPWVGLAEPLITPSVGLAALVLAEALIAPSVGLAVLASGEALIDLSVGLAALVLAELLVAPLVVLAEPLITPSGASEVRLSIILPGATALEQTPMDLEALTLLALEAVVSRATTLFLATIAAASLRSEDYLPRWGLAFPAP